MPSMRSYLMRVHVYKAEAFGSVGLAAHQSDVPLIQVSIGIQRLQNHLHSGGVFQVFDDHGYKANRSADHGHETNSRATVAKWALNQAQFPTLSSPCVG